MKPVFFLLYSLVVSAASLAQRTCALPVFPENKKQLIEFIFMLDSLKYRSGKVHINESVRGKITANYKPLSDSVYSVRMKDCTYLLNTQSGRVTDSKNGQIIYRNTRLSILESEKNVSRGTDSLGSYTAYFGNFRKEIPSRIIYEPQHLAPDKTIQYTIRCTPLVNDSDSSWIERDTTRIIRQYSNGTLISERTERMSVYHFPEIIEYHYFTSGDTSIQVLAHFEDGLGGTHPFGHYVTSSPYTLRKHFTRSETNSSHHYSYTESVSGKSKKVTDSQWEFKDHSAHIQKKTHVLVVYETGEPVFHSQSVELHFSGRK